MRHELHHSADGMHSHGCRKLPVDDVAKENADGDFAPVKSAHLS